MTDSKGGQRWRTVSGRMSGDGRGKSKDDDGDRYLDKNGNKEHDMKVGVKLWK